MLNSIVEKVSPSILVITLTNQESCVEAKADVVMKVEFRGTGRSRVAFVQHLLSSYSTFQVAGLRLELHQRIKLSTFWATS